MQANTSYAVVWDLDGTLVDSGPLHYETWRETLRDKMQFDLSRELFDSTFGKCNADTLAMIFDAPLSQELVQELGDHKEALYRKEARELLRPISGALELVAALHTAGWKQAIATSAPRLNLVLTDDMFDFNRWIPVQLSVSDVSRGKPDPEIFLLAAERSGVMPERCVVVEDSPAGIMAARSAGMASIGVATTHEAGELKQADRVVESLEELSPHDFERLLDPS
jgi:beta-phosphoglucomutase